MDGERGSVRLYHPCGVQVTLPVGGRPDYAAMLDDVAAALAAGWLATAPGLEGGESKVEIGWAVRKEKANHDGSLTPVIDLYPADEGLKFSFLSIYLNRDEDVTAFERATGLRLRDMVVYDGDNKLERGANPKHNNKFARLPRPAGVVWVPNPQYNEAEAQAAKAANKIYKTPRRKFVRWAELAAAGPTADRADAGGLPDQTAGPWVAFLKTDPPLEAFNLELERKLYPMPNGPLKQEIAALVKKHAATVGWVWDRDNKEWFRPEPEPADPPF